MFPTIHRRKKVLSSRSEASELLREVAGPMRLGDSVKTLLLRAHRKLASEGWSFNRVRDVYHQDPRIKISADELNTLSLLMAGIIGAAYFFDGPKNPDNAIKPVTCISGDPHSSWICPGETRVMQVPVKPGSNL